MQIVPPLYLLQTFIVFSEQENLVQTAERLGLTQPTVSRQLQQLEELFSQPLFMQQGRNKVLTDYARALVNELKPRFTDLERVFQKIDQSYASPKEITLRIGGPAELLEKHFANLNFAGTLELICLQEEEIQDRYNDQSLDLAISAHNMENAALISKKLQTIAPALVIPNKWASEIENAKDWAQASGKHPAAAFSKNREFLKDFEEKYKLNSTVHFVFGDWAALERRIHTGKSWGILPSSYLKENRSYKVIPLNGLFDSKAFHLSYRKELSKYPWMRDLLTQII